MDKSRNYVVFGVLALVVSLVAVSLAYAGFTQTLTINGAANVKGAKWDVHFENINKLADTTVNTNSSVTQSVEWVTEPTLVDTVVGSFSVKLATPGDQAAFTFDTVNDGNWAANLTNLTLGTVSCTAVDGWAQDSTHTDYGEAQSVTGGFNCATAISYKLYDMTAGGTEVTANNSAYSAGNLAANGGSRTYKIELTYLDMDNETITPKSNVTVTVTPTVFSYTQSGAYQAGA